MFPNILPRGPGWCHVYTLSYQVLWNGTNAFSNVRGAANTPISQTERGAGASFALHVDAPINSNIHWGLYLFIFKDFIYLCMRDPHREREREGGRDIGRGRSRLMQGAQRGTWSQDLGSRPEPKADTQPLSHSAILFFFFNSFKNKSVINTFNFNFWRKFKIVILNPGMTCVLFKK